MYDNTKLAAVSEDIKSKLLSGDSDLIKTAGLAADEYFRTEIRENGIRRNITPPRAMSKEDLDYDEINSKYDAVVDNEGYLTTGEEYTGDLTDLLYNMHGLHTYSFEAECLGG